MKLILSRKGFDSSFGGCASPIFEDDTFVSLPIPERTSRLRYSDIGGKQRIGSIVEDLTSRCNRSLKASDHVHLDPDLRFDSLPRKTGWRPLFGQAESAQSHLDNNGVGPGDIFLFFGWFRRVEECDGRFRFRPGAPDIHMFFGWLEVGAIWRLWKDTCETPNWASEHPHIAASWKKNTIYVAAKNETTYQAGVFRSYSDQLVLTAPGEKNRSQWRLPKWFHPAERKSVLSYHGASGRWTSDHNYTDLKSVGRGQEFILDTADYPEAVDWARSLIAEHSAGQPLGDPDRT
jgi:Nucleotide modification associated domain 3